MDTTKEPEPPTIEAAAPEAKRAPLAADALPPAATAPSHFVRALALTTMAVVIAILEIVVFGLTASHFGIAVEVGRMPLLWTIVFYALFLIPGLLLVLAILNIMFVMAKYD